MKISIEDEGRSTKRPFLKILISDDRLLKKTVELNALIDTGSDISFISKEALKISSFNFYRFLETDKITGKSILLLKVYYKIPMLIDSCVLLECAVGIKKSSNPHEMHPDILLGRDFLKKYKMAYDGPSSVINIDWIG